MSAEGVMTLAVLLGTRSTLLAPAPPTASAARDSAGAASGVRAGPRAPALPRCNNCGRTSREHARFRPEPGTCAEFVLDSPYFGTEWARGNSS
jgi:hypothetical protein